MAAIPLSPMRIQLFILLIGATCATHASAQAQADVSYDGHWSATILAADGKRQVSRLELRNFGGTWYGPTTQAKASCKSRKAPVTVQESNATALAFTVWGKTAGPGCEDLTVELKPVADNVLEGTVESVGSIKLVRR